MKPLVSMIVPVYNGEKVIERCLKSLISQTYENIEIIVLNDGSTDHTMQVLNKYAEMDSRIRIVDKANSGVSDTRNRGLELASGEFVQFVDSDDWLPNEATEQLVYGMLSGCEMVICDYNRVVDKNIIVKGHIPEEGQISRADFALYMMKAPANYYYGVLWNKMFRMDIIREHRMDFPVEIDWCEDLRFNLEYLQYVKHVYVLQKALYYYVLTKGSLAQSRTDISEIFDNLRVRNLLFEQYKALYESLDLYDENKLRIRSFYIDFARDKNKAIKMIEGIKKEDLSRETVVGVVKDKIEDTIESTMLKIGRPEVISKPAQKKRKRSVKKVKSSKKTNTTKRRKINTQKEGL